MGFTADFYNFQKKGNSTAVPTGTPSFSYPIVLTEECSIYSPRVIVRMESAPNGINYCYIREFGRYYFVLDWMWSEGRWIARMKCDVLASYRDEIASNSFYFLRSSTAYDGNIMDTLYPAKKNPVITQYTLDEQWWYSGDFSYRTGYWILGIVSQRGTTEYYAMDYDTYRTFCDKVLGTIDWANLNTQEISDSLTKALFNPFQYVVSCMWFPDLGEKSGWFVPSYVALGWWRFDTEVGKFEPYEIPDSAYIEKEVQLSFSKHPQSDDRGEYLNKMPYRYCYLYMNPFGIIPVDSNLMNAEFTGYDATMRVDLITGMSICRITGHNSDRSIEKILAQVSCQFGVPVQISDINSNVMGSVKDIGSAVSSFKNRDFLGVISGIGNAINDSLPQIGDTINTQGSVVGMSYYPTCVTICYEIVDEDKADNGRPYCKNGTCRELGVGYYIVENGNIALSGSTIEETNEIRNYLEGGFYYA